MKRTGKQVFFPEFRKICVIGVAGWLFYRFFYGASRKSRQTVECDFANIGSFRFYSQGNMKIDQTMFEEYFSDECNGVFVDVGANDGVTFSNSKFFEESLGWRGICVEPHPEAFTKLSLERPRCININAGVSTLRGKLEFLKVTGYSEMLSGFSDFMTEHHRSRIDQEIATHGGNVTSIYVESLPLGGLLSQYHITHVDLMSVDVEGHEIAVLKTLDFSKVFVRYIVLEENTAEARKDTEEYMSSVGYKRLQSIEFNGVYARQ